MMEMVQGEGGVVALDADYVQSVADYCHAHDILIIVDEVQTGVGRTGTFLACEQFGLKPDLVTLAKGLGGGLPIGAVLASKKVADTMGPGSHGSTFGGNPVVCAGGCAVLDAMMMRSCATSTPAPPSCGRVLPPCRMSHLSAAWA